MVHTYSSLLSLQGPIFMDNITITNIIQLTIGRSSEHLINRQNESCKISDK